MNKINISLFIYISAFTILISCSQDSNIQPSSSLQNEVTFSTGEISTRVDGTQFEIDDVINVEAYSTSGSIFGKELYTYSASSSFTSSNPFLLDEQIPLSYTAVYPANVTSGDFADDFTFNIETDQTTHSSYEQSDMLVAKIASTSLIKPELSFYHTMAIIAVNITGANSMNDISAKLYAQSVVTCNIEDGSYSATGSKNTILPYITSSGFEALVAPQQLTAGTIADLTIGENEYTWESNMSSTLLSGYKYSYTWSINEDSGENSVTFNGMINDWANGEWTLEDITTDQKEGQSGDNILLNAEMFNQSGDNLDGELEIQGVTFRYSGINITKDEDSSYFEISESGYIVNSNEIVDISRVLIDSDSDNIASLVLSAGTTLDTLTELESIEESLFSYIIPSNILYLRLSTKSSSVKLKQIEFLLDSE